MEIISPHILFNNLNKGPNYTKCQILSVFAEYSVIFGYFIILGVVGEFDEQKLKVNIPLPAPPKMMKYPKITYVHKLKLKMTTKLEFYANRNTVKQWKLRNIKKLFFFLADSYLAGFQSQQVNKISVWLKKSKIFTKVSWIVLLPLKIKKKEFLKNITENLHFLNTNTESNKDRSLLCKI